MIRMILFLAVTLGLARHPDLDIDVRVLSRGEKIRRVRALLDLKRRRARRWACDVPECDGMPHEGWLHRHARWKQRPPTWFWTTWLLMAGRGFGKTRAGSEAVKEWAKKPNQFIAVVAKNDTLVREICFESKKSGLLAVLDPDDVLVYQSSKGNVQIIMKNGTIIRGFSGEVPDNLRGWAFDKCWADEYAAWNRHTAQETLDMVWFCLREASEPQVVITTTPKPLPHVVKLVHDNAQQVKEIAAAEAAGDPPPAEGPKTVIVAGHMDENRANLSTVALDELENSYAGTRLGDQELAGILLEDVEGALWQRAMFETDEFRLTPGDLPVLERKVVAVDPATTTTDKADETGFAVCARGPFRDRTYTDQRPRGYVLASETSKLTPKQTMERAAQLYHLHQADAVVIEANNGGDYLPTVLQMVDPTVNWRVVHATRDKRARATPVAALYEQGRIHHVHGAGEKKSFDELEQVMTTYVGASEREEKSPDILDALVWGMWDLFLDPANKPPSEAPRGGGDTRLRGRR